MKKVAVSGGFDPVHIGHVQMFEEARRLGDRLVVILNCDAWLMRKKGFIFMPAVERAAIISAFRCVDEVYIHESDADDVSEALIKLAPDIFANGGDRKSDNTPEGEVCKRFGIQMAFNVGGDKIQSSSELVDNAKARLYRRPWGGYKILDGSLQRNFLVKTLYLMPDQATSLQSHKHRDEFWMLVEGEAYAELNGVKQQLYPFQPFYVGRHQKHRIYGGTLGGTIVEVMRGEYDENDITRYEDNYGRA